MVKLPFSVRFLSLSRAVVCIDVFFLFPVRVVATDRLRSTAIIPSIVRTDGAIYIVGNETFTIENSNPPNITSSFSVSL